MAETDKLERERKRGHDAEALLDHPLWVEARAAIRERLMNDWKASPVRDTEARERIWMMVRIADLYEQHIKTFAETGRLAAKQIADAGDRKKIFGVL